MTVASPSFKEQYEQMDVSPLPEDKALCKNGGRCLAVQGEISFIIDPETHQIIDIRPRVSIGSCLSCDKSTV